MARTEYSLASGGPRTVVLTALAGAALTAFAAKNGFITFRAPRKMQITAITLNVNQRGGTHSTSTLDVLAGATSLLGAVFNVASLTPGTPVDKEDNAGALSAAAAAVAKDTLIKVTTAESGGTSPTWADVTVQIDYIPL